jgi:cytochrome oxidase Cu insertion factor (SCO1/SenC/PrrC family)
VTGRAGRAPTRTGGARQAVGRRHRNRLIVVAVGVAVVLAAVGVFLGVRGNGWGGAAGGSASPATAGQVAVGAPAPDGAFTTLEGRQMSVADLRGQPTLLWFVTTWCSSCQAGTQVIGQHLDQLRAHGVRVVELMLDGDLGQPGPSMGQFKTQLAGTATSGGDWTFGTASQQLTRSYDPDAYLDIYYLLDRNGTVRYANGSPASTLSDLLAQTEKLT